MKTIHFIRVLAFSAIFFVFASTGRAAEFEAAEILFTRAVLEYDDGNYPAATRDLLQAHDLDPGNIDVIYYLGLTYNAQGNFGEAAQYLVEGVRLQPKNIDLHYELGISLYGQNRYDDALKEFLTVLAADPHRDNAGYYAGLCYYRKNDFETAANYFRRNVSSDVKTRQLNQYYLGLALHELGRDAEAAEELTEGVKIEPASPIVGPTQQLLTAIREETGGKRLRLEVTFNAQYDSNPEFRRIREGSFGNLLNARADYVLFKAGPWESTASYSLLQTVNYENHRGDLNDNVIGANIYHRSIIAGMPTIAGLQLNNDLLLFGGDLLVQRPTATFTYTVQENPSNFTTAMFRPQYKDFLLKGVAEKRRAANELLGLVHYIRFGAGQHLFNFGYQWDHEDARSQDWRYTGHKAVAGLLIRLPWELRWATYVEYHARFYPGQNFESSKHRKDQEPTALTSLSKDITPHLTATFQYLYDRNMSTITDFRIRREVFATGLTWRY